MNPFLTKCRNQSIKLGLALMGLIFASAANAAIIYDVADTSVQNCNGSPHGLWTGNSTSGPCGNYFSITGQLTIADDLSSALLDAKAVNPQGVEATIQLEFSGFEETYNYKKEGGIAWSAATDSVNDIDFFTAVQGVINLHDGSTSTDYTINGLAGGFGLQYGIGANAKDPNALGASAWILGDNLGSHHWDLNLNLSAVPEPSSLGLLSIAVLAGLARRRRLSR